MGKKKTMEELTQIIGEIFGRLKVLEYAGYYSTGTSKQNHHHYKCLCDCGNEVTVRMYSLLGGNTNSCGCFKKEKNAKLKKTHGMSNTRFYKIWRSMKERCLLPNNDAYKFYGGRGIKVCEEWLEFENFMKDMHESYLDHSAKHGEKNTTIDRIDSNGNYEPINCRWATDIKQARNTRSVRMVEYEGKEYKLVELLEEKGIIEHDKTIRARIDKFNWSVEDAINTPIKHEREEKQ